MNGSKILEECSYDLLSDDAEKIMTIHKMGQSQYLKNCREFGTPDENRIPAHGQ